MNLQQSNHTLFSLINASVSPYHAVADSIRQLQAAGFSEWKLNGTDKLVPGGAYYTNIYGTTLVAFRMPKKSLSQENFQGFRIATAHTDNPCFRVKPHPDHYKNPLYHRINVEAYGGAILSTWMDRPLVIAGRICVKGEDHFSPKELFYHSGRPVAVIPNLAIHMNREVNKGVALKVQGDMEAVLTYTHKNEKPIGLMERIAKELGILVEDILDYDLYLNSAEEACLIGYDDELLQAPRLDNLTSCQSCLSGLIASESLEHTVNMIALFDNEECGSRSKQGAGSTVLVTLLEKILLCSGIDSRIAFLNSMLDSFILSLDVAHAAHPNHPEKSDPTNPIALDGGVIIKLNTNQRYATDSTAVAVIEDICKCEKIPYQKFVNHGDITGGGTLGSILSSTIPAKTVDVGVPLLGMHSSRELMAASSQLAMNQLVECFFQ